MAYSYTTIFSLLAFVILLSSILTGLLLHSKEDDAPNESKKEQDSDTPSIQLSVDEKFSKLCDHGMAYCQRTKSCELRNNCKDPSRCISDYSNGQVCAAVHDPVCDIKTKKTYCNECASPQDAVLLKGECDILDELYDCNTKEVWSDDKYKFCEYENFEGDKFFNIS